MTPPTDFTQAYGRFLPSVRAKCRRLLGRTAAAEDVAQEAFISSTIRSAPRWHRGDAHGHGLAVPHVDAHAIDLLRSQRTGDHPPRQRSDCRRDAARARQLRLALVPGRYVVRRVVDGRVYSREIEVRPGATVSVDEAQLQVTGSEKLALTDRTMEPVPSSDHSTLPRKWGDIRFGLGSSTGRSRFGSAPCGVDRSDGVERELTTLFSATYGITDRLSWTMLAPAFTYRFWL